jgi:uncharacterized protein YjeT (DUF2065 family)
VAGFFLASFQALSVLRFCGLGKMLPMAKRAWRQLMNDYIGGADHQVRRAGGLDVKAEMEHIAINDFIVASFDA